MSGRFLLVMTVSTYICLEQIKASQFTIIFINVLSCLFLFMGSSRNKGQKVIYFPF